MYPLAVTPFSQALATTNLISVSMDLLILDILYRWHYIIYSLCTWLISLNIIFSRFIHVVGCISFYFMAEQYSIVCLYNNLFINSAADGHLHCFHFLVIMNNAMNIHVRVFVWTCFQFSRYSIYTILHSYQLCMRLPISSHTHRHLLLSVFCIIAILKTVSHWEMVPRCEFDLHLWVSLNKA